MRANSASKVLALQKQEKSALRSLSILKDDIPEAEVPGPPSEILRADP
jgi:hypothetical protein